MRIKRAPKKSPSTNAAIAAFILQLGTARVDQLGTILEPIISRGWCWPRTDLQHWIVPLNRFDQLLEEIIMGYELGTMQHPQTNDFTPRTKELLTAILKFEKVLLENSTNRKIFASFDVSRRARTSESTRVEAHGCFSLNVATQRPTSYDRPLYPTRYASVELETCAAVLGSGRSDGRCYVWHLGEATP
jgi:hypothetical protein